MSVTSWAFEPELTSRGREADPYSPPRPKRLAPWQGSDEGTAFQVDRRPQEELAALLTPLVGLLTRASRRIVHDDGLADDAIQETFLAYWALPERPENPRAWLLHAVALRSLHLARSHRRRREHERRACLGRSEWSDQDDPARSLDHADLVRILDESLEQVPGDSRAVFVLSTFNEMDYAGIAAALEIPIGTVRSRLNRTRKLIRELLAKIVVEP